jgi:FkbM family methyltransferase
MSEQQVNEAVVKVLSQVETKLAQTLATESYTLITEKMSKRYLGRFEFNPDVLIDVGVSRGTPFLYEMFPDKKHVLIDPLPGFENTVRERYGDKYDFDFVHCGAGSEPGAATLRVQSDNKSKSTLNDPTRIQGQNTCEEVAVPVKPLDEIVAPYKGKFGLKIDTEGHELSVLKGATETLKRTEFVIAEVSIKNRFLNGYRFSQIVGLMGQQGFEIIDLLNPIGRVHLFWDCLFVKANSPLFSSRAV